MPCCYLRTKFRIVWELLLCCCIVLYVICRSDGCWQYVQRILVDLVVPIGSIKGDWMLLWLLGFTTWSLVWRQVLDVFLSLTCVVCNYFAQIMLCNVVWTVKTTKYANWLLFVFVLCYLFNSDYEHAFWGCIHRCDPLYKYHVLGTWTMNCAKMDAADYRRQIIDRLSADYRLFISGRIFVQ